MTHQRFVTDGVVRLLTRTTRPAQYLSNPICWPDGPTPYSSVQATVVGGGGGLGEVEVKAMYSPFGEVEAVAGELVVYPMFSGGSGLTGSGLCQRQQLRAAGVNATGR